MIPVWFPRLCILAERNPRRGVTLIERCHARAPAMERPWTLLALGAALQASERGPELRTLLAAERAAFEQPGMAYGLLIYRRLALLCGLEAATPEAWAELALDCERADAADEALRARFEAVAALNAQGRYRQALDLADRLEPAAQGSPADTGRLWRLRGVAQTYLGNLADGFIAHNRAIAAYARAHRPADIARTLLNRAWACQRSEDFAAALVDLERANRLVVRYRLPISTAMCERDRGLVAARLGDFGTALRLTVRARAGFVALEHRQWTALCDLHLGAIAYYMGLYDAALAAYRRAFIQFEAIGARRMQIVCRRNRAQALRAQGEQQAALQELRALEIELAGGDQLELAETLADQGRVLYDLGKNAAAVAVLLRAEDRFLALGNPPGAAECRLERGLIVLEQGDHAQAEALLRHARTDLSDRPMHHWRIDGGLGRCLALQERFAEAAACYDAATATIAVLRRRLVSEHASSGIFRQAQAIHQEALVLALQQNDPQAAWFLAARQRALTLTRREIVREWPAELQSRETELRAELRRVTNPQQQEATLRAYIELLLHTRHRTERRTEPEEVFAPVPLPALREQLNRAFPQGWTLLAFAAVDQQVIEMILDAGRLTLHCIHIDAVLRRSLERACLPRYRSMTYLDPAGVATLAQLGETLIPPDVRAALHAEHRLLIVPDGILHALPWAALRVRERWLCEQAVVQLLPGETFWSLLAERNPGGDAALLIGCRDVGGRAPALPEALTTLDLVAARRPGVCVRLEDADASCRRLQGMAERGELRAYSLIHIAAHAQLADSRGLLAHIKLHDDDLLYDDITHLGLAGALVVLAACEGALGEVLPGDEVLSLSRAFLAAGARDVVAGLWQLYDAAVLALLPLFYDFLGQGMDAPTALAVAQRALIAEDWPEFLKAPLAWGGLCVIGAGTKK